MKTELVHGPTTMGLGSTTFLDGAPASSAAIKQDVINHAQESRRKNSIARKKSLLKKTSTSEQQQFKASENT